MATLPPRTALQQPSPPKALTPHRLRRGGSGGQVPRAQKVEAAEEWEDCGWAPLPSPPQECCLLTEEAGTCFH